MAARVFGAQGHSGQSDRLVREQIDQNTQKVNKNKINHLMNMQDKFMWKRVYFICCPIQKINNNSKENNAFDTIGYYQLVFVTMSSQSDFYSYCFNNNRWRSE